MIKIDSYYAYYLADNAEVCLVSGDRQYTRSQVLTAMNANAKRYAANAGDRVSVLCENRPEWAPAFLSAWCHHAIAVPIDAMANVEDIAYILGDCQPVALFVSAKTRETAEKAIAQAGIATKLLCIDDFDTWADTSDHTPMPHHEDDELALFIYTSGTTSASKGCMLTFHNLEVNFKSMTEEVPVWLPGQTTVGLLPYHHIFPLQGCLLMPLMRKNCKVVFCPSFNGPDILKTIHDNQVTVFIAVPRVFQLFRDSILKKINANFAARWLFKLSKLIGNVHFSRFLFHSVQKAFGGKIRIFPTGGAALDYDVFYDMRALGFEMLPGSGMSETSPALAFTRIGHPRHNSAGQLLDIFEGKIAEDGELLLRGDSVFKGYWNKPEETAKAFTEDGWFRTGDLCRIDEDRYVFYTGRKKELIILSNGKNVPPLVIEEKLMALGDGLIAEVAVVASGDVLGAIVLPDFKVVQERKIVNIAETIRQNVIAKYNQGTEAYMRVLNCSFVSMPLPRTRLGKLQRHKLAALGNAAKTEIDASVEPAPELAEYRIICDFLKEEQRCEKVRPDDHFEIDLGIDSLAKVELMVFLNETFDTDLTEEALADHPTPRTLAEFLHDKAGGAEAKITRFDWGKVFADAPDKPLPPTSWRHRAFQILVRGIAKVVTRTKFHGLENFPSGAAILAVNHQSSIDGALVVDPLNKKQLNETYFYAKKSHFSSNFARKFAERHNLILIDFNIDVKSSLQELANFLRHGKKVVIFPEGTRSYDGTLGGFKNAFAILAKELQMPIVPVVIDGSHRVVPRGRHFPVFGKKINVTFLKAFTPDPQMSYAEIATETAQRIASTLKKK